MDNLSGYVRRPFSFVLRYLRRRRAAHAVIVSAVVAAVACSVGTQYGVKNLVDSLTAGSSHASSVWLAFGFLMSLIAADNLLWRVASWTASFTFVGVTGDLRRDMFRHLTGHAPSYFSDRMPGMLTSRITETSNAVFTVENMFVWNVLPPCIATVSAILLIGTVSLAMSAGLIVIAGIMLMAMFRLAAAGKPLHDDFADKAAAVDGEMVDVISNLPLVRAFCGLASGGITPGPSRWSAAAPPSPSTTSRSTIPAVLRCSKSSPCAFSRDSGSGWSVIPAAENPACSRCCSGSTTFSAAASRSTARTFRG